jgi:hypothetical protein
VSHHAWPWFFLMKMKWPGFQTLERHHFLDLHFPVLFRWGLDLARIRFCTWCP